MSERYLLLMGVAVAIGAGLVVVCMKRLRPQGLDYLGSVSERWISELRGSSDDSR